MPAPKRRRWFSLSLRSVMIGMTLISVGFAWFLHHRRQKIAEKERLYDEYHAIDFGFEDVILGWEIPYHDSGYDRWWWLRAISAPQVTRVEFHFDMGVDETPVNDILPLARGAKDIWLDQHPQFPGLLEKIVSANTRELVVTNEGPAEDFEALALAPNLRELHCIDLNLSESALALVLAHPTLEVVYVETSSAALSHVPRSPPSQLQSLAVMCFFDDELEDRGLGNYEWVDSCTKLQSINLSDPKPRFLRVLGKQLHGVENLDLSCD